MREADSPTSKRQPLRGKSWWDRGVARARAIRCWGAIVACLGLTLLVGGCDPNDRTYFRQGIGTELYTADTASATELQNIYLDYLCQQSGSYVGANAPSCPQLVPGSFWPLIVQAGMNDIDARCDSYLAWLDQKRRENAGILTEIGAVRFAVDSLTNPAVATGVSPVALAAISAAFGLATSTVNNFNSLLLQVDHTTVQSVVFVNRRLFRQQLLQLSAAINNKPTAVHALRSYLTICMPMTISANINSTVTVFQQAGPNAIDAGQLVSTSTISDVRRQLPPEGFRPAAGPTSDDLFNSQLDKSLCVQQTKKSRDESIRDFFVGRSLAEDSTQLPITNKTIGKNVRQLLKNVFASVGDCRKNGFRNAFEVGRFGVTADNDVAQVHENIVDLQNALRNKLGLPKTAATLGLPVDALTSGKLDADTRKAIAAFRKSNKDLDQGLGDQVDSNLFSAVTKGLTN